MKRKLIVLVSAAIISIAIFASCSQEPDLVAPSPGFGIITLGVDGRGIVTLLSFSHSTGNLMNSPFTNQPIVPAGATGRAQTFDVTANSKAKAIVPNGIAPAFWQIHAISGWDYLDIDVFGNVQPASCDGKSGVFTPSPGQFSEIECRPDLGILPPTVPSTINVTESAVEIEVPSSGVTTTYGMPTFQFYDPYGTFAAQTTATSIDTDNGLWAKGQSTCLTGLPAGTYTVDLINGTANGVGEKVGSGVVYLYGASSANPIDDNQFFVAQQYRDFLNREPDQSGLNFWTSQVNQCSSFNYRQPGETYADCAVRERVNVSLAFWASQEFLQLHPGVINPSGSPAYNNSEFVRLCHVIYLQRDPTQADQDFWTGDLVETNNDYGHVIKGFINSDEYRLRFEPPPPPPCQPSQEDLSSCTRLGGSWDYSSCTCNGDGQPPVQ
jgi:hypothetical protein